ncbi:MAG: nucleoside triphosphate pyrophosphohydrolase [Kiritimatiellia bacterium]|nr:nucleoside triphosphate pyrophosphohydrolase [Kiritimatiellia bacterium]
MLILQMKDTSINRLIKIMARMRAPGGCPWDREQTLKTLKQYLIEECYEVIDAIDSGDIDRHAEELGDLLLQVVFQAQIRAESKQFTFEDVVKRICAKLIRRHPHVFGNLPAIGGSAFTLKLRNERGGKAVSQKEVLRNWEKIKASEKTGKHGGKASVIEGIPRHLPALHKAHQFQQRLARVGFDWTDVHDVMLKVEEELQEVKDALAKGNERQIREEVGDLLFAVVNLCRFRQMHAEEVLQDAVAKFACRFQKVERRVHAAGQEITRCTLAELDKHWEAVKKKERKQKS